MVEGLLQKQGLYSRAWKVRYCVLTESGLAYSAHQGANGANGANNAKGFVPISSSAECLIAERDGQVPDAHAKRPSPHFRAELRPASRV